MTIRTPLQSLNTENLTEGLWIKNYKELCTLLEQPVLDGGQKKNQLQEFGRFISFEKIGRKFLITEIYDEPLPFDYQSGHSKYAHLIINILLSYLSEQSGESCYFSKTQLQKILGLVNHNYSFFHKKREPLFNLDERMTQFNIDHFFWRCDDKMNKIIQPALDRLKSMNLIDYREVFIVSIEVPVSRATNILDFHEANEEEIRYIMKVKREELEKLGFETEHEVHLKHKSDVYYKNINKRFKEDRDWTSVFKSYYFIYNKEHIVKAKNNAIAKEDNMRELNKIVLEAIDKQAETKYENREKHKCEIATTSSTFFYPVDYVPMQKKLSQHLIKLKEE